MVGVRRVQAISEGDRLDQLSSHPVTHILSMQTHCQPETHTAVVDQREASLLPQSLSNSILSATQDQGSSADLNFATQLMTLNF